MNVFIRRTQEIEGFGRWYFLCKRCHKQALFEHIFDQTRPAEGEAAPVFCHL